MGVYLGRDGCLYSLGLFRVLASKKTAFPAMFGGSLVQYLVTVGGKPAAVVAFSPLADYLYNYLEAAFPEESVSLWAGGVFKSVAPAVSLGMSDQIGRDGLVVTANLTLDSWKNLIFPCPMTTFSGCLNLGMITIRL